MPALAGKTQQEVKAILNAAYLKLGEVQEEDTQEPSNAGKVIRQTPAQGSNVASGASVDITVGRFQASK